MLTASATKDAKRNIDRIMRTRKLRYGEFLAMLLLLLCEISKRARVIKSISASAIQFEDPDLL
jgi:hypothetical protein